MVDFTYRRPQPDHVIRRVLAAARSLAESTGRPPSDSAIALLAGLPRRAVGHVRSRLAAEGRWDWADSGDALAAQDEALLAAYHSGPFPGITELARGLGRPPSSVRSSLVRLAAAGRCRWPVPKVVVPRPEAEAPPARDWSAVDAALLARRADWLRKAGRVPPLADLAREAGVDEPAAFRRRVVMRMDGRWGDDLAPEISRETLAASPLFGAALARCREDASARARAFQAEADKQRHGRLSSRPRKSRPAASLPFHAPEALHGRPEESESNKAGAAKAREMYRAAMARDRKRAKGRAAA